MATLAKRIQDLSEDAARVEQALADHETKKRELKFQLAQLRAAIKLLQGTDAEAKRSLSDAELGQFVRSALESAGGKLLESELGSNVREFVKENTGSARGWQKRFRKVLQQVASSATDGWITYPTGPQELDGRAQAPGATEVDLTQPSPRSGT